MRVTGDPRIASFAVRIALGAATVVSLAACGQKGPLYLPDKGGEVITRPAAGSQGPQSTEAAPQPAASPPDGAAMPDNAAGTPNSDKKPAETPPAD